MVRGGTTFHVLCYAFAGLSLAVHEHHLPLPVVWVPVGDLKRLFAGCLMLMFTSIGADILSQLNVINCYKSTLIGMNLDE